MYPEDKRDLKPSPIIRSAVETLNTFINEEGINLSYANTGAFDMMNFKWAEPPATMAEGIVNLEALAPRSTQRWSACRRKTSSSRRTSSP